MANELKLIYPKTGATVTAKAFYDNAGTLTQRSGTAPLTEDADGIYRGNAVDITGLNNGDMVIYYDDMAIIASETYDDGTPPQVDLIDTPNATAVAAIQTSLATTVQLTMVEDTVAGIASNLAGTLGSDGKALISGDSQDLSDTLHVDAGTLAGSSDTAASLAIAAAFWANKVITTKADGTMIIRNYADNADLYTVAWDETTDPTKLIRTITAAR